MASFTIVLGNKNYSSWSLRPWLALKAAGEPFGEIVIPLRTPDTKARILEHSPSGKVPVLKGPDGLIVWETLAIVEYLAERFPNAKLWPADPAVRAVARSVANEMHAGFGALRSNMPMNVRMKARAEIASARTAIPEVKADIDRIQAIWSECRTRFGNGGDFLFGTFGGADAMFAPVVCRFRTYGVNLGGAAGAYADAVWNWPALREWRDAAEAEPFSIPQYDDIG